MSEQSDRIRAALSKSGIRRPSQPPMPESAEAQDARQPSVAVSEEALAGLLGSRAPVSEPPEPEPVEVETTLPIIAASDEERVAEADYEDAEYYEEEAVAQSEQEIAQPEQEEEEAWQPEAASEAQEPEPVYQREAAREIDTAWRAPVVSIGENSESRFPKTLLAIAGGVVVIAGVVGYLFFGHSSPTPARASFPLQLAVEPQGNGLMNIHWNPQSAAVSQAREGRLVVTEKDQPPKVIALESAQLKIGHVYYQSPSERLEFRLEVIDRSGAKAEESVLALSSGTPPAPVAPAPVEAARPVSPPASAPTPPPGAPPADTKAGPVQVAKAPEPAPAQPSRPAARQFTLPAQQSSAPSSGPTILQDAPIAPPTPSVVPPGGTAPDTTSRIQVSAPAPKETPRPVSVGGVIRQASLIKKVAPVYPPLAKSARIQGTVRFNATISKNGTVQNVQLVSGPAMLVQSATDAVKQWVYQPMLLNGQAVEVITQVDVTFALGQ